MRKIRHLENLSASAYFRKGNLPVCVRVMNYAPANREINMHGHEFSELVILARGSVKHVHEDGTVRLRAGDFFVIHPGLRHGYAEPTSDLTLYNVLYRKEDCAAKIAFYGCSLAEIVSPCRAPSVRANTLGRLPPKTLRRVIGYLNDIRQMEDSSHSIARAIVSSLFTTVILELSHILELHRTNAAGPSLSAELEFIRANATRHISADEIAAISGVSKATLFRTFRKVLGMGPGEYQLQLRLSRARNLLSAGSHSFAAIAAQTGFHDASHLSRALKTRQSSGIPRNPTDPADPDSPDRPPQRNRQTCRRHPATPKSCKGCRNGF